MKTPEEQPLLSTMCPYPDGDGFKSPRTAASTQAIAHRGFKAQYPENTLIAFEGAVRAGAHAIETDLHISRDGVIMISHDPTLRRCFGVPGRVLDLDVAELKKLRTVRSPHVAMPTLFELLELLSRPDMQHVWLLLDIKTDNNHEEIMRLIAETVGAAGFERERVVLGCWTLDFVPLAEKYLPGFQIVHIGYSIPYAREFLRHPNVSFNIFFGVLAGKQGQNFIADADAAGRRVFAWTVNDVEWMKWAISRPEISGICTDEVSKFLELRQEELTEKWTLKMWITVVVFQILAWVMWQWRFGIVNLKGQRRRQELGALA